MRPMSKTAYYWDELSLHHDTGSHVECIARAQRLAPERMTRRVPGVMVRSVAARDVMPWILGVHRPQYIDFIRHACEQGPQVVDGGDTVVSLMSYDAAVAGVCAALCAADAVMSGEADNACCAVRPPGHHALPDRAMGFCLFGNVAIAARYLQKHHGLSRIAIVDWDVHHGNGTNDIFYEDPSVFYVSLHQFPLWPGTGRASDRGRGEGEGYTLNIPIAPDTSEADYLNTFDQQALPALENFKPEFILISAGFDAHRDDPLGSLCLTEDGFGRMTRRLKELAATHCHGRIISCLEGGYNLDALESSVAAHVQALMD
jgi:acetoin utilization deacetylase AcuC-like enzyme